MTLLGEREMRRWVRLVALVSAGLQKSTDLVLSALVRARFCELLSTKIGKTDSDLFLVGLLSVMDAILEIPMAQILEKIPIDQNIRSVLLDGSGPLRPVYQLMLAREAGSWESAREFAVELGISESQTAEFWWDAMKWAREVQGGA
jgi:c-di-GMP-related signal transduction protein